MRGYFVIADITGYTMFLTGSELDHAQDILKTLFNTLIDSIKPPLTISNYQGDAILTYAPDTGAVRGQTVLEIIENTYFAFASTLERMQLNTTCRCNACANMGKLDLKLFVHYGEYALQELRGKQELSGSDVIIAHRMMKNDVKEKHGVKAYVLFTDAAIKALKLDEYMGHMGEHSETYEHIGTIPMWVYDLKPRWLKVREERRLRVDEAGAWIAVIGELPAPPSVVWDYVTSPERRKQFLGAADVRLTDVKDGRVGVGSLYHCDHGTGVSLMRVMDWKPFDFVTEHHSGMPFDLEMDTSFLLTPIETGTRIAWTVSRPYSRRMPYKLFNALWGGLVKSKMYKDFVKGMAAVRAMIEAEAASGKLPKLDSDKVGETPKNS